MKLVKEYLCDDGTPSDEEIRKVLEIVKKEDCIVKLRWFFPYSGRYELYITKDMSFEECMDALPKCYPV